jgi:CBS domain-containing protein
MASIRDIMREKGIGCMPIIVDQHLVGMITDTDIKRLESEAEEHVLFKKEE